MIRSGIISVIYWTLYVVGQLGIRQFYRRIDSLGAQPVQHGPVVVVSNHFNGLMDVLVVACHYLRQLWFTAKSTLFNFPANLLFWFLPVLPIYRPEDGFEGDDNQRTFSKTSELLTKGGAVLVFPHEFPEGFQTGERRLHRFKTGAVRMAFAAEELNDWKLGVRIQPVGINYSDFFRVGQSVTVVYGEPVLVADWRNEADPWAGVKACTAELEARMRKLTVEVPSPEFNELMETVNKLYIHSGTNDFARLSTVAANIGRLAPQHPELAAEVTEKINRYLDLGKALHIQPGDELLAFGRVSLLILISPLVLFGMITHVIPHRGLEALALRLTSDPYFAATTRFLAGLLGFPLWYALLYMVYRLILPTAWWSAVALAVTIVCGILANRYRSRVNVLLSTLIPTRRTKHIKRLRTYGQELRSQLEAIVEESELEEVTAETA